MRDQNVPAPVKLSSRLHPCEGPAGRVVTPHLLFQSRPWSSARSRHLAQDRSLRPALLQSSILEFLGQLVAPEITSHLPIPPSSSRLLPPKRRSFRALYPLGPRRSRPHPSPNRQVALSQFSPSQLRGPRNLALLPSFPPLSPCVLTQVLPPSVSTDRINGKLATPAAQMSTSCWTGFSPGSHRLPWYKSPDPRNAVLLKQRSFFLLVIYLPQIQAI